MPKLLENICHLHLDVVGGIAGDMFVAACVDAFPELEARILEQLPLILPASAGQAKIWSAKNGGMSVKRFALSTGSQADAASHSAQVHASSESHSYAHGHAHSHSHSQSHSHSHRVDAQSHSNSREGEKEGCHAHHTDTRYVALKKRIEDSELSTSIKVHAISILEILAKAEAKMHATTVEEVHFHELADWDSLMDVVAAGIIFDALALKSFSLSKLPIGGGLVNTQHGLLPAPAPATAEILRGFDFFDDGVQGERITPTGAAIVRHLANCSVKKSLTKHSLQVTGYGAGEKSFAAMPNILRVMGYVNDADQEQTAVYDEDTLAIIEFDIDDMSGEELAVSLDYLRRTPGVIDITVASLRGKKQRAVEAVKILAEVSAFDAVIKACFIQTSTLGLRHQIQQRKIISRDQQKLKLSGHDALLHVKIGHRPDGDHSAKVESDSLQQFSSLAERRRIKYAAERSAEKNKGEDDV